MMKEKILHTVAIFTVIAGMLSACGISGTEFTGESGNTQGSTPASVTEEDVNSGFVPEDVFWIVTEETITGDMSYQIPVAVRALQEKYPDLEVRIDYLKNDNSQETEMFLQQIRTDIITGNGPDVYILSTGHYYDTLFNDVNQTMRNGHFLDIGCYYDSDSELGKEALNPAIMDAGIWEGVRYVLPLRYDMSVYMVDTDRIAQTGKDLNWFENTNLQEKMDTAITEQNQLLMQSVFPSVHIDKFLMAFPDRIDYKSENVLLKQDELSAFWQGITDIMSAADISFQELVGLGSQSNMKYLENGQHLGNNPWPVMQTNLYNVVENVLVSKAAGVSYAMLPVRDVDGGVTATIAWWGALGSSCTDPEIGYEYLRLFLTEEYQWEMKRPPKTALSGMVGNSWPVRDKGAVEHLYSRYQSDPTPYSDEENRNYNPDIAVRAETVASIQVTDSDFPFLDFQIDNAYFPHAVEYNIFLSYFRNCLKDSSATPDPEELTETALRELTIQIAEG